VLGPWLAELAGLVAPTIRVVGDSLALRAPAIEGSEPAVIAVGMTYSVGLVIGAAWVAEAMRVRIREAQTHLHLQAWQLRQLVPR
jgi:hypothetical protein